MEEEEVYQNQTHAQVTWKVEFPCKDQLENMLNWFEQNGYRINRYEPLDEGNFWIVSGYKEI